jgi:hypothetical protein
MDEERSEVRRVVGAGPLFGGVLALGLLSMGEMLGTPVAAWRSSSLSRRG